MQFFAPPRENFFRPLTHDNRELCAAVLRALHERVHGANADYAETLTRDVVLEVILRALADPMLRALAFDTAQPVRPEEERAYAGELLRKLKEHGWLEDYRDPIDLKPTLKLSRAGKVFSESFANLDDSRAKTRQRNMRSARKALAAFIATRDADELLDAHEFASRVVQDLQDDIEYFRHLIQSLTREALAQKVAWNEFNDFIEKRFVREYAVRLVADSAERHRGQIIEALDQVRALDSELRALADGHLLQRAPWLEQEVQGRSPLLWLAARLSRPDALAAPGRPSAGSGIQGSASRPRRDRLQLRRPGIAAGDAPTWPLRRPRGFRFGIGRSAEVPASLVDDCLDKAADTESTGSTWLECGIDDSQTIEERRLNLGPDAARLQALAQGLDGDSQV
jgi:hypothetical protein